MVIQELRKEDMELVAPLVADFRVKLRSFKGISSDPDVSAGAEEMQGYMDAGFSRFS